MYTLLVLEISLPTMRHFDKELAKCNTDHDQTLPFVGDLFFFFFWWYSFFFLFGDTNQFEKKLMDG